MSDRRQVLLRVDPAVHDALMRWANDEFRSLNAQVEMLLRRALADAGRMPKQGVAATPAGTAPGQRLEGDPSPLTGHQPEPEDLPADVGATNSPPPA